MARPKKVLKLDEVKIEKIETPQTPATEDQRTAEIQARKANLETMISLMNEFAISIEPKVYMLLEDLKAKLN